MMTFPHWMGTWQLTKLNSTYNKPTVSDTTPVRREDKDTGIEKDLSLGLLLKRVFTVPSMVGWLRGVLDSSFTIHWHGIHIFGFGFHNNVRCIVDKGIERWIIFPITIYRYAEVLMVSSWVVIMLVALPFLHPFYYFKNKNKNLPDKLNQN